MVQPIAKTLLTRERTNLWLLATAAIGGLTYLTSQSRANHPPHTNDHVTFVAERRKESGGLSVIGRTIDRLQRLTRRRSRRQTGFPNNSLKNVAPRHVPPGRTLNELPVLITQDRARHLTVHPTKSACPGLPLFRLALQTEIEGGAMRIPFNAACG